MSLQDLSCSTLQTTAYGLSLREHGRRIFPKRCISSDSGFTKKYIFVKLLTAPIAHKLFQHSSRVRPFAEVRLHCRREYGCLSTNSGLA